jgi:osmoprotectant transport system substrate-binding protein
VLALALAGALVLSACGGDDDDAAADGAGATPTINVGRIDTPVGQMVTEIYSQGLENAGYRIGRKDPSADQAAALDSMKAGNMQFFAVFSQDLLAWLKANGGAGSDATAIGDQMTAIRDQLPDTMTAFEPANVDNGPVIACGQGPVGEHDLAKVGDLADAGLTLGGTEAFRDATSGGLAALNTAYGSSLTVTAEDDPVKALTDGTVDCAAIPALTPEIVLNGLIVLEDDQHFAAADQLVVVMTTEAGQADVQNVADALNGKMTTDVLRALLVKAQNGGQSYDSLARQFLGSSSSDQG